MENKVTLIISAHVGHGKGHFAAWITKKLREAGLTVNFGVTAIGDENIADMGRLRGMNFRFSEHGLSMGLFQADVDKPDHRIRPSVVLQPSVRSQMSLFSIGLPNTGKSTLMEYVKLELMKLDVDPARIIITSLDDDLNIDYTEVRVVDQIQRLVERGIVVDVRICAADSGMPFNDLMKKCKREEIVANGGKIYPEKRDIHGAKLAFHPHTGSKMDSGWTVDIFRCTFPTVAWFYNPFNGARRDTEDLRTDTFGWLIIEPGSELKAAE
jgi:hypothetical protein